MTCYEVRDPKTGLHGHLCARAVRERYRPCEACGKAQAVALCDGRVPGKGRRTRRCDRAICEGCATSVGEDLDHCPTCHERALAEAARPPAQGALPGLGEPAAAEPPPAAPETSGPGASRSTTREHAEHVFAYARWWLAASAEERAAERARHDGLGFAAARASLDAGGSGALSACEPPPPDPRPSSPCACGLHPFDEERAAHVRGPVHAEFLLELLVEPPPAERRDPLTGAHRAAVVLRWLLRKWRWRRARWRALEGMAA